MDQTPTALFLLVILYSAALPLGLAAWWKKRTGEKPWCFLAGALCFLLFAMLLEQGLHSVCLMGDNAVSRALTGSALAYTLYGCFTAGIFEETGRLFGFQVLLKKHREKECAVAYGIGHGGIEVFLVLGVTYLVYLLVRCGVPFGDAETTDTVRKAADAIPAATMFAAMFERLPAILAHIGLSMMVFPAAREKGKIRCYFLAVLMHALMDAPAALYQFGVIRSVWVVETAALVTGLACLLIGKNLLARYSGAQEEE